MSNVASGHRSEQRFELEGDFMVALVVEPDDYRAAPVEMAAKLLNLSARGAKLEVPAPLERNKTVRFQLAVEHLGVSFYLSARVCWSTVDVGGRHTIGCELSPQIPDGILNHVAEGGRLDRRDQDRRPTSLAVDIVRPGARFWNRERGQLRNYATGGVCLETSQSANLGERFRVRLKLAGVEFGVIVRWEMQQGDRRLIGCEYEDAGAYEALQAVQNTEAH